MRLVDIFSGCGGLSLGFDLHESDRFRTVLAVDNAPSAIKLYNANFEAIHPNLVAPGRVADVCWYRSSEEIRLFYLAHVAVTERDAFLRDRLVSLGYANLLGAIKRVDEAAAKELKDVSTSASHQDCIRRVPDAALNLATVRKVVKSLGLKSLKQLSVDFANLPWSQDYLDRGWLDAPHEIYEAPAPISASSVLQPSDNRIIDLLAKGAVSVGTGQHAGNASKYNSVLQYLRSEVGALVINTVTSWLTDRARLVAAFVEINGSEIDRLYFGQYRADGLLGGPPCKGFSRIGRPVANALRQQGVFSWSDGEFGDERNQLVLHYVLFLEALEPTFFVFENVSNFKSSLKTPDGELQADALLEEAIENLSGGRLHFDVAAALLTASDYGVPQKRKRFIMFGLNKTHCKGAAADFFRLSPASRQISVADAFAGLAAAEEFTPSNAVRVSSEVEHCTVQAPKSDPTYAKFLEWIQKPIGSNQSDAHVYRRMRDDDAAFIEYVAPGIRWMDLEIRNSETLDAIAAAIPSKAAVKDKVAGNLVLRLLLEEISNRKRLDEQHLLSSSYLKNGSQSHGDWLERMSASEPSKTIVAHIGKDTYGYIHPYHARPISIREAARLQMFPDRFRFGEVGVVDAYTAIGNAVPPGLSYVFAGQILNILSENDQLKAEPLVSLHRARQKRLL